MTDIEIRKLAMYIVELMKEEKKELLTTEEKAKQIGISVSRLYKIKDKFRYQRLPGTRKLLFYPW